MFSRLITRRILPQLARSRMPAVTICTSSRLMIKIPHEETQEQFEAKYIKLLNQEGIDGWDIRQYLQEIYMRDVVPEPNVVVAALKAIRRVNDHSLAVRFLETVKHKCGNKVDEIYPWIIQEIRPTLDELGISLPEDLGYNEPELHSPLLDFEEEYWHKPRPLK